MLSKKPITILGIALAGIMTLGSVTALATGSTSLVAAKNVTLEDITYEEGTATIVEGVTPQVIKCQTTSLTVAAGVTLEDITYEEGTTTIAEGVTPQGIEGQTTAASSFSTAAGSVNFADSAFEEGTVTAVEGIIPQKTNGHRFTTPAGK